MKQFFKTSLYVAILVISGIVFQLSCSNSNDGLATNTLQTQKLIFLKQNTNTLGMEIWTCDYDGGNQSQVVMDLPPNVNILPSNSALQTTVKISPDGTKIFFVGYNTGTVIHAIYSCDFSGQNVQQIVAPETSTYYSLEGVN